MTLTNVAFTLNTAPSGGAVYVSGDVSRGKEAMTITGCLFSDNKAVDPNQVGEGGGLNGNSNTENNGTTLLLIRNDTFYHNTADKGGAIQLHNVYDGGTTPPPTAALNSLTITANTGNVFGGGLLVWPTSFSPGVGNCIIAGNQLGGAAATAGPDMRGAINSLDYNLIGQTDGSTGFAGATGANDQTGTSAKPLDPVLNPNGPADNGGPTQTIKLARKPSKW